MSRFLWHLLSGLALLAACLSLWSSWLQPSPQTQLDLFQTNLALQASRTLDDPNYQHLARALLGSDVIQMASNRYQQATDRLSQRLSLSQSLVSPPLAGDPLPDPNTNPSAPPLVELTSAKQQQLTQERDILSLRSGILLAYQENLAEATRYWQQIETPELAETATAILGLWASPRRILPDAELLVQRHLDGWFEATTLQRLFSLQQRGEALNALTQSQEKVALAALGRLTLVGGLPLLGSLLGLGIGLGWIIWVLLHKQDVFGEAWSVPWTGRELQRVLTTWFLGFLILGWLVPQIYLSSLQIQPGQLSYWQQAIELFLTYNCAALWGLGVIYQVVRRYQPLPPEVLQVRWFSNWPLWGISGYWVAIPLVSIGGIVAEWLLPQAGGGNPILPLILQSQGWAPRLIFFTVVSISAPLFEETLFRGFVLSSLTRYLPAWGAVGLSALLFAIAHLNLADLIPLTVLGFVLGMIYTHSRNLLAPMLLHSCWNAGSLVALLILGGN
ncbi:MAG: type II CAAX endopeptidase family protein [Cyanobacteriota bacterium]|nr:type II CAAX endopeptidase family protein [Cyanobacteriota bacterium]